MKSTKGSSLLDVADLLLSTKTKELNEKDSQTLKDSHTLWNFRDTNFLDTLASLASEKSPLKSNGQADFSFQGQRRPRSYSESYVNTSSWNAAASILPEVTEDHTVPSMLDQYTSLYNKNGRIGIYTKQERNEIIERFREKRRKRVWKKKIRYHCRKNLADKRIRIKGRFVKKIEDAPDVENENESSSVEEMDEEIDESPTTVTNNESSSKESPMPTSERVAKMPTANGHGRNKGIMETETDNSSTLELQGRDVKMQGANEEGYERMRRHSIAY